MNGTDLPPEAEYESIAHEASTEAIVKRELGRAEAAIQIQQELMRVTIAQTHPEDWVLMGGKAGFLMEAGCFRISKFWGIAFDRFDPLKDCVREEMPGGHVQYLVALSAVCKRSEETATHIGVAGSADKFFKKRWASADNNDLERKRIENDIRKAAISHCKGAIIRELTGTKALPLAALKGYGVDTARCQTVTFQEGSEGGATAAGATDGQKKFLASLLAKHTADLPETVARKWLDDAAISKKACSELIENLKERKAGRKFSRPAMRERLGLEPEETHTGRSPDGGTDDPAQSQSSPPPEEEPPPPVDDRICPGCHRSWDLIETNNHAPDCPEA